MKRTIKSMGDRIELAIYVVLGIVCVVAVVYQHIQYVM